MTQGINSSKRPISYKYVFIFKKEQKLIEFKREKSKYTILFEDFNASIINSYSETK